MFTDVENFESLNKLENLRDGIYREICSHYQNETGSMSSLVREFTLDGEDAVSVCDLLIVLPDQSILFRDYLHLPDGTWRDSYGNRSEHLPDLFPKEIFDQRLLFRTTDGQVEVHKNR